MATDFYTDAALLSPADYIDDEFGNPLTLDDLPWEERLYFGDPDVAVVIRDAANPGVNNVTIKISHLVAEWSAGLAVTALDEIRTTAHNGYVYKAQGSGTTGGAEPTWPIVIGQTVNDNGITWECVRKTTEPESLKLATTQGGLAGATPGAALDLGVTTISGGAVNAVEVWVEAANVAALVNVAELYLDAEHLVNEAA